MCDRLEKISVALDENEAMLITSDPARRYLIGFGSSAGAIVITRQGAWFFIDFRYFEKAQSVVKGCNVLLIKDFTKQLGEFFEEKKIDRLYVETSRMNIEEYSRLVKTLKNVEVSKDSRIDSMLYGLFMIKNEGEVKSITAAQKITDSGFEHILEFISEGVTEREIALELEFYMRRLGSEGAAFDFIAVSGENSSLPHGVPTDRKIQKGDFITLDFGAVVNGYRSDMTRTVAISYVSDEQRMVYDTVLKAQMAALKYLKEGILGCDADRIAREIIENAGYGECFGHSLGHSVGIEIHERPNCSPKSTDKLKSGTIMTVEPGIYLAGKFGVRIEDMVMIKHDGVHNFTESSKELIIL